MVIKRKTKDGVVIVNVGQKLVENNGSEKVDGFVELDISNKSEIDVVINTLFEEKQKKVIMDMENITYLDSSSLWTLFEGHKKMQELGGKFVLVKLNPDVQRIFDLTKISKRMEIFPSEEAAVDSFK